MNLGDYLIWEATNGLLLIPTVIGLVMLVRRFRGRPVFSEKDWLFLFGHSRKEVFSLRRLLRFGAMLILVVLGSERYVLRPVRALLAATRRLSGGDLAARTGGSYAGGESRKSYAL